MPFPSSTTPGVEPLVPGPRRAPGSGRRSPTGLPGLPGDIVTVRERGAWVNLVIGGRRLPGRFGSRYDAIAVGEETARLRRVGHVVLYARARREPQARPA